MRTWVDGALVAEQHARVSAHDHGLTVGDGAFETIKVVAGRPFALTRHLERLARSALGLGLPGPDLDVVRLAVAETVAANRAVDPTRLRITYTAGVGPLGSERGGASPTLVVAMAPLPPWSPVADVVTVPWARNERSPIAGLKTTSYAENVVALAYAARLGASEAIFANTLGQLCEGTGSNVFLGVGGRLLTPSLATGCLGGVTRALVLGWVGAEEAEVPLAALAEADEAFLTSTTRDVLAIGGVNGRRLPVAPGPLTSKAAEVFAARSAEDSDP